MIQTLNGEKQLTSIPEDAVLVEGSLQGNIALGKNWIPLRKYVVINDRLAIVFAVEYNKLKFRYVLSGGKLSHPYDKQVKVYDFLGTMNLPAELSKIP